MCILISELVSGWMLGWIDGGRKICMGGQIDAWLDGSMDEWMW